MRIKKTLFLITICLFLSFFSLNAFAAETEGVFTYTISNETVTLTKIDSSASGVVEIPSTLGGYPVTILGSTASGALTSSTIDELVIPETVQKISSVSTFGYNTIGKFTVSDNNEYFSSDEHGVLFNKTQTELWSYPTKNTASTYIVPDTVTSIRAYSFITSYHLEKIVLSPNLTTIGNQAFYGCTALKHISIPDGVSIIEQNTFAMCYALENLDLSDNLKEIKNSAFTECYALKSVIIPESCTNIGTYAFENCGALTRVTLPKSLITVSKGAFGRCTSLSHVYYAGNNDDWNQINIVNDTSAYNNDALVNAERHYNFDSSLYKTVYETSVNDILTISGTGSLPTVEAGASHYWDEYAETATAIVIDGEITTIGSNSFTGFSNISTIIIRTSSITIEPDAFVNCPLLENVLIFGNSSFTPESFNGCADAIKVFENADKQHSFTTSDNTINVIPFDFEDTTLQWNGKLTLDAYNFFDIIAAFCNEYDEVKSIKVNSFTGEGFIFYRYNEKTYNSEPIEGNTLNNAEFSVLIDSYETGPVYINFNQLCDGITDGSISTFYLIVEDETEGDILDTEVEVKDEEEKSWFEKALEWIVSLLNKLFKILSRFK